MLITNLITDMELNEDNQLYTLTSSTADSKNALRLVNCMRNVSGNSLTIYGEKIFFK